MLATIVTTTLLAIPPSAVAAPKGRAPAVTADKLVRVDIAKSVQARKPVTVERARSAAVTWPAAGEGDVSPAQAKAAAKVAGLPVLVTARDTGKADKAAKAPPVNGSVHVTVADQAKTEHAGVAGVLFSVAAASTADPGPLSIGLDYSGFRDVLGAGYADRLRLVQLPACALTTPDVADCRTRTPLPSRNDGVAQVLSADVTPTAPAASAKSAPTPIVLAAVADVSGSTGSFAATPLSPSGSWSVTANSGAFSWNYPVAVPPAAAGAGVTPSISLNYNSAAVDGRTSTTNNQTSWIGQGWDYQPGYIERTYRQCSDDKTLPAAQQTDDLCWAGQLVTMNLGSQTVTLVRDDTTGAWHPRTDDGSRVELVTDTAPGNNGARNGEYWKVTTTDGTQYFFGKERGPGFTNQERTNSAWTVPVYGPRSTDPCYNSAGFAQSSCAQAWRWNLDFVRDTHGNTSAYYYDRETNYYGANKLNTAVSYTRGGTLKRVDYGLREIGGSIYTQTVPNQVVFTTAERCTPAGAFTCADNQFTTANALRWPDVPVDQNCASGSTCTNHAPSFWSRKRLTTITTQYNAGTGPVTVDSFQLGQSLPELSDSELRLDSITHTGYSGGTSITQPAITFTSQSYDNHVQGYGNQSGMPHWRLTDVTTDTGGTIKVTYSLADCTALTVPTNVSTNTSRCFPVYRTLPGNQNPTLDFFHKYVVTRVVASDAGTPPPGQNPDTGRSPDQVTDYAYLGGAAWHYDDNELVKPEYRTYGQFRGYRTVEVRTGDSNYSIDAVPDQRTLTRTTYFTGMDQDVLPGNAHRSVAVTNSVSESVPDNDLFAGTVLEVQDFNGDGGARVSSKITNPVTIGAATATRNRTGLDPERAVLIGVDRTRTITALAVGGNRTVGTSYRYDSAGRPVSTTETADGLPSICTTRTYADNTTSWIRSRISQVLVSQQDCPTNGSSPTPLLSGARTYFDGSTVAGAVPGAGDITKTETITAYSGGVPTWTASGAATFDASGRTTSTTDQRGFVTSTAYTPADGGVLSKTVTTNAKSQTSSVEVEPARGKTIASVDVGGRRTEMAYDALGRLVSGWQPGRPRSGLPTVSYEYLQRTNAQSAITAHKLVDTGTGLFQTTTVELFDAFGQKRQTQTETADNTRLVEDHFFDSHGWEVRSNNRYLTAGAPNTSYVIVTASDVDDRTITGYDGFGREVKKASYQGLTKVTETRTIYGGDRTTSIAPSGGVSTTVVTDARGHGLQLLRYTAAPTVSGDVVTGGTAQTTAYRYTTTGLMDRITDNVGNVWSYDYDFLGRKTSQTDPDSGTSTYGYDLASLLTSTTDARGKSLAYEYDQLGRKTAIYPGTVPGVGAKVASFSYDGATNGVGLPYVSTRYTTDGNFISAVTAYDTAGNPNKQLTQIPASVTGLNALYTTLYSYTSTGQMSSTTPAAGGGLPGEVISFSYDRFGKPITEAGYNTYVQATTYTGYGEPKQFTLGPSSNNAYLSFDYDAHSRKPTQVTMAVSSASTTQVDDTRYSYDAVGNITKSVNTQGAVGSGQVRTQCYGYDALNRLEKAWTATDSCVAAPSSTTVGGPDAYWLSWTFDAIGLRSGQVKHGTGTASDTSTTYTYQAGKAHALASTTTTGPSGTSTDSFGYDAAGNTTSHGNQTLTWDDEGRMAGVSTPSGATSYTYDASGSQLVRRTPSETTVYLPGEELSRNNVTGVITGTRYYKHGGVTVAERVAGGNPKYLVADLHGTSSVAVDAVTFAVTRRTMDPYGNPLGTGSGGPWPDKHGFLNKPVDDSTGLADLGARKYDAVTGRFLSVDPELDPADPDQLCGYSYADNDPVGKADPTGLLVVMGIGAQGVEAARGYVADLQAIGPRNYKVVNTQAFYGAIRWKSPIQGPGIDHSVFEIPFVIFLVTLVPWANCTPAKPKGPTVGPSTRTRAERAAYDKAYPQAKPTPADKSLHQQMFDFLASITGVQQAVDCFRDPNVADCVGFAAPFVVGPAAGLAGRAVMGAGEGVAARGVAAAVESGTGASTSQAAAAEAVTARSVSSSAAATPRVTSGAENVANGVRLRAQLAGDEIAGGHAYEKHVIEQGEYPEITGPEEFARLIEDVIVNGQPKTLGGGRSAYWYDGTIVIRNPRAGDGGTAFRPVDGYDYFLAVR